MIGKRKRTVGSMPSVLIYGARTRASLVAVEARLFLSVVALDALPPGELRRCRRGCRRRAGRRRWVRWGRCARGRSRRSGRGGSAARRLFGDRLLRDRLDLVGREALREQPLQGCENSGIDPCHGSSSFHGGRGRSGVNRSGRGKSLVGGDSARGRCAGGQPQVYSGVPERPSGSLHHGALAAIGSHCHGRKRHVRGHRRTPGFEIPRRSEHLGYDRSADFQVNLDWAVKTTVARDTGVPKRDHNSTPQLRFSLGGAAEVLIQGFVSHRLLEVFDRVHTVDFL